ncbi:DUF4391 domain-containing protein [Thiorhodovibrio frisius]|uniref:Methyl-accepting chemotaxis protein n=1 Tax=Thiorhodovibrio frisius TaxID=631362 RepID=H8Z1B7_9GAMM|nr:DUF4391 domain-containing protein [Thiorhodovibrio frisius]EIC21432.1 hypothetical protein Thi970DRAFT_01640 [Thiorhodovibrio frisius]WPL24018.1 hypothetical protein Thiofri_04229 [Thiorhodovibrio frisius]
MNPCFAYPPATRFGRVIPKNKIYQHASATAALKRRFVALVDHIRWAHKLAPATLNLNPSPQVPEIQVFHLQLREPSVDTKILRAIDQAIPFPLIFELTCGERLLVAAAHKRPSEADKHKWVISEHFHSDWRPLETERAPLPVATSMDKLYEQLLSPLLPVAADAEDSLPARIDRTQAIAAQQRAIDRLQARLRREPQFNRRVAINAELRDAVRQLHQLNGPTG